MAGYVYGLVRIKPGKKKKIKERWPVSWEPTDGQILYW